MPTPPIKNQNNEINGLSITALVLGIISILTGPFGLIIGIIGLILSIIQIKKSKNTLVTIGLILSIVGIIFGIFFTLLLVIVFTSVAGTIDTLSEDFKEKEKCFPLHFQIENIDLDSNTITINSSSKNLEDLKQLNVKVNGATKYEITKDKFDNSPQIIISVDIKPKEIISLVPILNNDITCYPVDSVVAI
ncbi:hypothetical protein GOV12_04045 [Candidatus Pacearchaeota archaeon]|nr:hypothetical protein [Candidatus Pacearchaeota archaeon]